MPERQHYPELDVIKAAAIATVVLIHALPDFWTPGRSTLVILLSELTRFAVPSFLAVSGFLYYQQDPISFRSLGRRFRRILVPYVCISVVVYAYGFLRPQHVSTRSFLEGLLLAKMFGPYYYIFVLTEFVCLTWLLSRMPGRAVVWFFAVAAAVLVSLQVSNWNLKLGVTWTLRNPFLWLPWFLLGWVAAAHRHAVLSFTSDHRMKILLGCVIVIASWALSFTCGALTGKVRSLATLPLIVALMVGIFAFNRGRPDNSPLVATISESTYAIYLLHPFFVLEALALLTPAYPRTAPAVMFLAWVSGLLGSAIAIAASRSLLGRYSRDVIGA
jgi:peptidoglycan/LPS O-acetylase OafA/YrhL